MTLALLAVVATLAGPPRAQRTYTVQGYKECDKVVVQAQSRGCDVWRKDSPLGDCELRVWCELRVIRELDVIGGKRTDPVRNIGIE